MAASPALNVQSPFSALVRPQGSIIEALMGPTAAVSKFAKGTSPHQWFEYPGAVQRVPRHVTIRRLQAAPPTIKEVAALGSKAIAQLPENFRAGHRGEFIAIAVNGDVLALGKSFAEVASQLRRSPPNLDYYVAKLGQRSLGEIR